MIIQVEYNSILSQGAMYRYRELVIFLKWSYKNLLVDYMWGGKERAKDESKVFSHSDEKNRVATN